MSYKVNFICIKILITHKVMVAIQHINIYFTIIVFKYVYAKGNISTH